ncbi:MAG: ATP-binding protein [Bacteroidales bacterium]|nr:ATP-binding protein [Bacteroidales bacterium]
MKAKLKEIILENQNKEFPVVISRNIEIPLNLNIIITLIGTRRSGKTYILYQKINELIKSGIKTEQILFLNFEDERLKLDTENLDQIIQAYTELFPEIDIKNTYFFFDEIQNVTGWEKFVRRIFDTKSRHVFITGSNSKLLSTEIATELRGRTITYTVYPLSLSEYLDFHKISKKLYPQKNKSKVIHYTQKFLTEGGFPETVFFDKQSRLKILQQYFNTMIFRDVVERYKISDVGTFKFFLKKIFAGVTKPFSINKAYSDLKSLGYKISNKYLYEYFDYCNTVFISQSINKFDFSEIKQEKSEKKIYVIDNGLLSAIEFSVSRNNGKLLENMVALEFMKAEKEIFYFKKNKECDFIVKDKNAFLPVQVSYEISNNDTKQRELKGLAEACKYLNLNKGIIITFDQEEELTYKDIDVSVIPVYKYFLE